MIRQLHSMTKWPGITKRRLLPARELLFYTINVVVVMVKSVKTMKTSAWQTCSNDVASFPSHCQATRVPIQRTSGSRSVERKYFSSALRPPRANDGQVAVPSKTRNDGQVAVPSKTVLQRKRPGVKHQLHRLHESSKRRQTRHRNQVGNR
jgi:hypothetical protein